MPSGPLSIVHSSIVPNGAKSWRTSSSVCCLLSMPTNSFLSAHRHMWKEQNKKKRLNWPKYWSVGSQTHSNRNIQDNITHNNHSSLVETLDIIIHVIIIVNIYRCKYERFICMFCVKFLLANTREVRKHSLLLQKTWVLFENMLYKIYKKHVIRQCICVK